MSRILTEIEKNAYAKQYEPLVNKLTKQFADKVKCPWDDIKSMAYEGLVLAMNTYDNTRSKMTFAQYAGFAIRNNILTSLNNELRTVKLSAYAQKKALENGEETFNTISIDATFDKYNSNGDDCVDRAKSKDYKNMMVEAKFADGDIFETLYSKLEENFSVRDQEIFYMTFGLKDHDEMKGLEIAKALGISCSLVSVRVKAIIKFIQNDDDLIEILSNLLK